MAQQLTRALETSRRAYHAQGTYHIYMYLMELNMCAALSALAAARGLTRRVILLLLAGTYPHGSAAYTFQTITIALILALYNLAGDSRSVDQEHFAAAKESRWLRMIV